MLPRREATRGREYVSVLWPRIFAKELQAKADEGTFFVHDAGGDIDIDEHSSDGGTNGPAMNSEFRASRKVD